MVWEFYGKKNYKCEYIECNWRIECKREGRGYNIKYKFTITPIARQSKGILVVQQRKPPISSKGINKEEYLYHIWEREREE